MRIKGEITASVDGVDYRLRLDLNTLAAFEAETDQNALEWLDSLAEKEPSLPDMIALMRCALGKYHRDAAPEVAGEILSEDLAYFSALVAAAMPDADEATSGNAAGGQVAP